MKAVQVIGSYAAPRVIYNPDVPKPIPTGEQLLIKVRAAGITGDEVTWPELYENPSRIPGTEVAGEISAVGPDYKGQHSVGENVWALLSPNRGSGQAEYCIALDEEITLKPFSLSFAESAVLPIPLMTAWEGLFERAKIGRGERVFVTGASGAVGKIIVQVASQLVGAEVTTLSSARHHKHLRDLGSQEVLDYEREGWDKESKDFDFVIDTVGGEVLTRTWDMVKGNGIIITVGPPQPWAISDGTPDEQKAHPGVKCTFFIIRPNAGTLEKARQLIDSGNLESLTVREFPVESAPAAWKAAQQRAKDAKSVIIFT